MVRTRAQAATQSDNDKSSNLQNGSEGPKSAPKKSIKSEAKSKSAKRQHEREDAEDTTGKTPTKPPPKKTKVSGTTKEETSAHSQRNHRVAALLERYTALPLADLLSDPTSPTPETLLALLLNATLTSARISHELAEKTVACVIKAGYHDIQTLKSSSWTAKTEVLTKGGYTRYREKTATMLDELADVVLKKYDGDLNNMLKQTNSSPSKIRAAVKQIKGIGDVGVDIFFDTAQGVWPCLAPFVDPRSAKTAQEIGLGGVEEIWEGVGRDPFHMCRLCSALTTIRLEKIP